MLVLLIVALVSAVWLERGRRREEERERRKKHYPASCEGHWGGAIAWRSFGASDLEPRMSKSLGRTDNLAGTKVNITLES